MVVNSPAEEEGVWKRVLTEAHSDALGYMNGTLSPTPLMAMKFKFHCDAPANGTRMYYCTYGVYTALHKRVDIEPTLPRVGVVENE